MRRHPTATFAVLILLAPLPAAAGCPTAEDLDQGGVWISYQDDWYTHTYRTGPDLVVEVTHYGDGSDGYWFETWRGLHILREASLVDGKPDRAGLVSYTYPISLGSLPGADATGRWEGEVAVEGADGAPRQPARSAIAIGPRSTITIGACSYETVAIHAVWGDGDSPAGTYALQHLPDLGVSVLTAAGTEGAFYDSFFRAVAIDTERPPGLSPTDE